MGRTERGSGWLGAGALGVAVTAAALAIVARHPEPGAHGTAVAPRPPPPEAQVVLLPLGGILASPEAEISGMAWHGDTLVLLPQYPAVSCSEASPGGCLLAISRAHITDVIAGRSPVLSEFREVGFDTAEMTSTLPGFEGFEAILFRGDRVWFTIECETHRETTGYLLSGSVDPALTSVRFDPGDLRPLPGQTSLPNMGYEALVSAPDGRVYALHEINGLPNGHPVAPTFNAALERGVDAAFPPLQFRITDATDIDSEGRFWVLNVYWPGDVYAPGLCPLFARYGVGETHARSRAVERLVELELVDGVLGLAGSPPIQLQLPGPADVVRNWEGLVRFDSGTFLIITDEHPGTLLGLVGIP